MIHLPRLQDPPLRRSGASGESPHCGQHILKPVAPRRMRDACPAVTAEVIIYIYTVYIPVYIITSGDSVPVA